MTLLIQPSFAKGVLAPSLHGRVDTSVYHVGLAKGLNTVIHPYGGVSNRPGTKFIGPCKQHSSAPRLIPFQFKTSDQYVLEFGNLYMRVIRNDGYVTETAVNITGATAANPVVITAVAHGYSNGDEVYIASVGGMVELNTNRYIVANKTANTFELTHQVTGANINGTGFTAYTSGGTTAKIYQITTPYAQADLSTLKYTQSADTMTITHKGYAARDLTRTGHTSWTLSVISFTPEQDHPVGQTVTVNTAGSETRIYGVTAIKYKTFEESLTGLNNTTRTITGATVANPVVVTSVAHGFANGDEVEINSIVGMTELNGRRFIVANQAANTFELLGTDGTGFTAYSSGGTANQTFVKVTNSNATEDNTIAWTAVAGAERYAVYRKDNGLWGLVGETSTTTFEDDNIAPDTAITPPLFADPMAFAGYFPGTTSYYEQRQIFGGSTNEPDTAYYSRVGDRKNMSAASPAAADDSFSTSFSARQVNEIRHFIPLNDLLIFTSGSEWRVNSGPDTAFELASVRQKPQSFWGCSHLQPLIVGSTVFFIEENNAEVRNMGYSFQLDSYTGTNVGLLANHYLSDNTVVSWSVQHSPEVRFYLCRNDGKLLTITFDNEQEVIAWTDWVTSAKSIVSSFESVCVLRHDSTQQQDNVYFIVKRKINGNTVRYVEKLADRINDDPQDCYYVDCGLTYDTPITITNITSANPAVVTATGHGLSNGNEIDIYDVTWEPDVDEWLIETQPVQALGRYKVANKTANTFELISATDGDNIDGSAWNSYVSGGTVRLAQKTFRGLDHLEGEVLVANADGNVIRDMTVSGGKVTFTRAFSRVHIGEPYESDIETLNIESPRGTVQGLPVKLPFVTVKFEASRGMLIGPAEDLYTEMKQREFERIGEPTRLFSGSKKITLKPSWKSSGKIFIRQKDPMPLSVLSVAPWAEFGDAN